MFGDSDRLQPLKIVKMSQTIDLFCSLSGNYWQIELFLLFILRICCRYNDLNLPWYLELLFLWCIVHVCWSGLDSRVVNDLLSLCSDRARHPALPLRLVGDALSAAEAGGGRTFAPASCQPVFPGVCWLHHSVVRLFLSFLPRVRPARAPSQKHPDVATSQTEMFINLSWIHP